MNILKYKYKAHKLVNTLFYIVVFVIGFVLGFGAKKLDFSELISQVLMIDNVSAIEIGTIKGNKINEEFIYNKFNDFEDGFLAEYPYIVCTYHTTPTLDCIAYSEEYFSTLYLQTSDNYKYSIGTTGGNNYKLNFSIDKTGVIYGPSKILNTGPTSGGYVDTWFWRNGTGYSMYSNFNLKTVTGSGSTYKRAYTLDFSEYEVNLEFNENLFKDNPDFKQVCVNPDTRFAITSNKITYTDEETELKYFNAIDFIWFSYVPDGLTTYLYSSAEETKKTPLTEDGPLFNGINPGYWYYLDEKEEIDKFFNTDSSKGEIYPGVTLELEGYTDKYSHFGWYFHPFVVHFDNTQDGNNFFNVFHFKDKLNFYSILENGLDYYEELENARNGNICFYIKNDYDITILNKDIFDDDIGETTILGGDKFDINTSENSSSLNSKGLFSKINLFINNIKDTILFINGYIYELYVSLPNIVQLFIISVFGLIVVSILVRMVTK